MSALQERDAVVERWLLDDVAPAYDAMKADPSRASKAEVAFSELIGHSRRASKRGS